jgi:hypothetical protein
VRRRKLEDRDVGQFASLQRADLGVKAESSRRVDCCHLDATLGAHNRRIEVLYMLNERAGFHLLDHVYGVVDHWPVRA